RTSRASRAAAQTGAPGSISNPPVWLTLAPDDCAGLSSTTPLWEEPRQPYDAGRRQLNARRMMLLQRATRATALHPLPGLVRTHAMERPRRWRAPFAVAGVRVRPASIEWRLDSAQEAW